MGNPNIELLNCPFCGLENPNIAIGENSVDVICWRCSATVPCCNDIQDACEKWNTRSTPAIKTDVDFAKIESDALDFICECIGAPKEYNDGKRAGIDWTLRQVRAHLASQNVPDDAVPVPDVMSAWDLANTIGAYCVGENTPNGRYDDKNAERIIKARDSQIWKAARQGKSVPDEWKSGYPDTDCYGLSKPLVFETESDEGTYLRLGHYNKEAGSFFESGDNKKLPWRCTVVRWFVLPDIAAAPVTKEPLDLEALREAIAGYQPYHDAQDFSELDWGNLNYFAGAFYEAARILLNERSAS